MLPCPYVGSYSGEKGQQFLQENWILALEKSIETFFMVSISVMASINIGKNLWKIMDNIKENILKQYRIGDTYFTALATVWVSL